MTMPLLHHTDGSGCDAPFRQGRVPDCERWHTVSIAPVFRKGGRPKWPPGTRWVTPEGSVRISPTAEDHTPPSEFATKDSGFVTKDSGKRQHYESGMVRDVQEGKPRFDLIFPAGVPYEEQLLKRFADLLARGAEKYGDNNWQLANSEEELSRFRSSALRHAIQWACGATDEDHATAVIFNMMAYENTKRKLEQQ